jgi:cytochrome P450
MSTVLQTVPTAPGRLPVLGHAVPMRVRPLVFLQSLRTHGEVVKIYVGPVPVYVLTSPEVVRRVLVEETHKVDQGRVFDKIRPVLGNGVATSEGAFHHRQRRLMQPAFHPAPPTPPPRSPGFFMSWVNTQRSSRNCTPRSTR